MSLKRNIPPSSYLSDTSNEYLSEIKGYLRMTDFVSFKMSRYFTIILNNSLGTSFILNKNNASETKDDQFDNGNEYTINSL